MRRTILAAIAAMLLAGPAGAERQAIEGVIGQQIEAFKADDFAAAFAFASPGIRRVFRTPETFGRMVAEGFPMVHRPADVAFGELREAEGSLFQTVRVRDADGRLHLLEYEMIADAEGAWRINGVRFITAPEVGV